MTESRMTPSTARECNATPRAPRKPPLAFAIGLVGAMLLPGACSSTPSASEAAIRYHDTPLDRYDLAVTPSTEVLEIHLDPRYPTLRQDELARIEAFVDAYRDRGHGPLIMALPENSGAPNLAIEAVKEARNLAWTRGVAWEEIDGRAYDAQGLLAPFVMSFDVFNAVLPECRSLAAYDLSDVTSNNEQAYFGCTVRFNLAQMLADPADLLGHRTLAARDNNRVSIIMEAYRNGAPTGAATGDEDVSIAGLGG